ncbi:hypothetical protein OAO01_03535 [Oligoflexia bacterium]|nr:hypothetical protein [Oligoflexia bacterium]
MDLKLLYKDIKECIARRENCLSDEERKIVAKELDLFGRFCSNTSYSILEIQQLLAAAAPPLYDGLNLCVTRLHEVAGLGSLPSCQSSMKIIEALYEVELLSASGTVDNLFVGRGHIAAAFFALRYLKGGFPLSFLLSLYDVIPPVISKQWGFSNTMRHSLGEGLPACVGKALVSRDTNQNQHFFCFVGDGELQEGISFEAIRMAYEFNLGSFTVIVDGNQMGITKLAKPLNIDFLKAYFDEVHVVENDKNAIKGYLNRCKRSSKREVIVCKTEKHCHTYKNDSRLTTCTAVGKILGDLQKTCNMHVFSPDLSSRFGLHERVSFVNTGLSEQATVALTIELPPEDLKVVLTDDKFLLNSLDCLQSAFASNQNIIVIAARRNAVWGGPNNTPNVFSTMEGAHCFELCNPKHLESVIAQCGGSNAFILLYDEVLDYVDRIESNYEQLEDNIFFLKKSRELLFISTESFAVKVNSLSNHLGASHLRFLSRRPVLSSELVNKIRSFETVIVYEQNLAFGGLGQFLRSEVLRDLKIFSLREYCQPAVKETQEAREQINTQKLIELTKRLMDV